MGEVRINIPPNNFIGFVILISAGRFTLLQHILVVLSLGYIYSGLDPLVELPIRLKEIPLVWKCVTNQGDALWV